MARMPATIRPAHAPKREDQQRQQRIHWKRSDEQRQSAYQRGYDRHWAKTRKGYILKHPLCCCCDANGYVRPVYYLDHIIPHKGDKALFWRRDNWQGLCKDCHQRVKAVIEHRFERGLIDAKDLNLARPLPEFFGIGGASSNGGDELWHPAWMRAARVPVAIVCGPVASGKNTYVAKHAAPEDTIIDLDEIGMMLSGVHSKAWPSEFVVRATEMRNRLLYALGSDAAKGRAWFIITEPEARWRQWWQDVLKPKAIGVLATPADECKRRAAADRDRQGMLSRQVELIDAWWQRYTPRQGDRLL